MVDLNRLYELTFTYGGPGEIKSELNESPSTQSYYQVAAQDNPSYAQVLADLHRVGDLQREEFNLKMPFLNNGLNNLYQEKLKQKEQQNELEKIQRQYDLANRNETNRLNLADQLSWNVRKYNRANSLADREHNENREDFKYNRELQRLNKERDLQAKLAFPQKPKALMKSDYANTNDITGIDMSTGESSNISMLEPTLRFNNLKNEELSKYIQQNSGPRPLSNVELLNRMWDDIRNNTTYENQHEVNERLYDLEHAYSNRYNNYRDKNAANFTPNYNYTPEVTSKVYELTGEDRDRGLINGISSQFSDMADKPSLNYLISHKTKLLDENANSNNKAYRQLVKYFNNLDPQTMTDLGYGNTNGLEGKRIFYDPTTSDFIVKEINNPNDRLQRFRIVSDGFDDRIEYIGDVDYTQFGKGTNNYRPIPFTQTVSNAFDNWSFNVGKNIGSIMKHPINSAEKAANYLGNLTDKGIEMAKISPNLPAFIVKDTNTVITFGDLFSEGTNLDNWKKIVLNAQDYVMSDEFKQLVQDNTNLIRDNYNKVNNIYNKAVDSNLNILNNALNYLNINPTNNNILEGLFNLGD